MARFSIRKAFPHRSRKPTKIKILKYEVNGKDKQIKVRIFGEVRPQILTEINNAIFFLPDPIKDYLEVLSFLDIVLSKQKNSTTGSYFRRDNSITLYDKDWMNEVDYSSDFMHELGHLIYEYFMDYSYETVEDDEYDPIGDFTETVNKKRIKPISSYTHDTKNGKHEFHDLHYAEELFAEYIGFTYSRYNDPTDVKGSFCNYLILRNAVFNLFDAIYFKDLD